ncbi:short-chain dehydrogenase/reductase SDR [Janibacter hoylei PVAS-1]|uniref:Short-chain dehydrogenase/reductase SDR n=1 Tax=Janibacter hoylei PVAS-1 TaxID=1210046 RepID=K1DUB1_9MICO|nr:short-chain dehydrogenase/reductase SDR [Janibacter hoylei PVAS-1]
MQITDTAAIVTGGASGLGAATAAALAAGGARVFAFDLPASIEGAPQVDGVEYVAVDVTDPEQVQAAVDTAAGAGVPLRTVVNCAGIGPSMRILGKKGPHDLAFYAKVVQVNLVGSFNVLTLAAEKISQTEALEHGARGIIINTASIAAYDGQVGQAAYSSSKGGIVGLTLPAARDLAQYGIRVMTIAPGIVETPHARDRLRGVPRGPGEGSPLPAASRPPRRVRPARAVDHRPRLPQRRGHPHGRLAAHGSSLSSRFGLLGGRPAARLPVP